MEWISDLLGGAASVASGGIFGFLGAITGAVAKHIQAKAEHTRKIELMEWDMKMFDKQLKANVQETELEIAVASAEGSWAGLEASIQADAELAKYSGNIANNIKTLFRPFLTTTLVAICAWIFWVMWSSLTKGEGNILVIFTAGEMKEIIKYVVYSLVFATGTAVVWWYGDRALAPPDMKNR